MREDRFIGKIAIVTGGSSGIGMCTAKMLALEGANVVICGRSADKLTAAENEIRAAGGQCMSAPGDVTRDEDCRRVVDAAVRAFGKVDILVNCAGDGDYHMTATKTDDALWQRMIDLNLTGSFYMCRQVLRYMEQSGSGSIVNLSAISGVYGNAGIGYSAAKAAIIGMTKNIALEYTGRNIRCNALCPGPTLVPRMDGRNNNKMNNEFLAVTRRHCDTTLPMSNPTEQSNVILFLASDESSAITGQIIITDNGRCL